MNVLIDYIKAKECKNREAWFICYKCGMCGRKFEDGYMVDDGGTTPDNEEEEEEEDV